MAEAEVGDDVFGEDPTVNRLQEMLADRMGKDAALFVASGTMGNQISVNAHTQPGQEILLEKDAHIFHYEGGAPAMLSGVQLHPVPGKSGVITASQVEEAVRPADDHYPRTGLICLENTHNRAGGTIYPLEEIRAIRKVARKYNLPLHLDGARLWNACVATDYTLKDYSRYFDSVSVCFSKGLGAPVGSLVAGSRDFIARAHRYRKAYGGGMRQAGILAAAALYALEHNVQRLSEDHENAKNLARALADLPGVEVDLESVQTNIVFMDVSGTRYTAMQAQKILEKEGVRVLALSPTRLRAVTHLNVNAEGIERGIAVFQKVFRQ
jgi:threonine aldolase